MFPLLAAALLAAQAPAPRDARVVEEIVAVVRNPPGAAPRVVTLTKLAEEARIALVSRGAVDAASRPLDAEALRAALDWLLDQMILADEAARLGLEEVDRDAVGAALRRFRGQFPSPAAYARFLETSELTEEELSATLARMVRVERYVQSRVGRAARVSDEEVTRYLEAHGARADPGPARDAARAQLEEEQVRAQVGALLAELRGRADLRVLSPPRGGS
ncbi:MAG TPA: hypothetical protein VM753_20705 [Anaeromyxobacter sp.]|nr:hypothetical protein [Anaeromyxobacter sp.]